MAKVRLSADVEPELGRLVEVAAASSGQSVSEWVEAAVWTSLEWEIQGIHLSRPGAKPKGLESPVKLRGGKTMSDTVIEQREERDRLLAGSVMNEPHPGDTSSPPGIHRAPPGEKPQGSEKPPRLRDGSTIAEVVIEDRR